MLEDQGFSLNLIRALDFAAIQHKFQRRKGFYRIPYINHPIRVVLILLEKGKVDQSEILIAAALHDVIEDTPCTAEEISTYFGNDVMKLVLEVTDDMKLPSAERKKRQVLKAPHLSDHAKMIKIADKIANMQDILKYPLEWSILRKRAYFEWAAQVAGACEGVNNNLDIAFTEIFQKGMKELK